MRWCDSFADICTDGIHLKQCITLYLFALPLTMVHELGWTMIPLVTVVAFTFMGTYCLPLFPHINKLENRYRGYRRRNRDAFR